ncbi:hypothetical protein [Streptomyces sp. NPDC050564]|uniref:hypothetical protein n=1 Tax=Streptomyces sp. NPDC050564 TaxID=3365631 RepID=UPI0037BB007A
MVAQAPQPKVKDRRTGEIATDIDTGHTLVTVDVLFVMNGNAEVVTVTVAEPDISGELAMGTPVALTRPWTPTSSRQSHSSTGCYGNRRSSGNWKLPRGLQTLLDVALGCHGPSPGK